VDIGFPGLSGSGTRRKPKLSEERYQISWWGGVVPAGNVVLPSVIGKGKLVGDENGGDEGVREEDMEEVEAR